jgi:ribosomal protein L6P/L9E
MFVYNLRRYYFYVEGNFFLLHGWVDAFKIKSPVYIYLFAYGHFVDVSSTPFMSEARLWKIYYRMLVDSVIGKINYAVAYGSFIKLRVRGRRYKITKDVNTLVLRLGYSHRISYLVSLPVLLMPNRKYKRDVPWKLYGLQGDMVRAACYIVHSFRKPNIYCRLGIYMYGQAVEFKQGVKPYRL